ncbi:MAG: N-6 DNA methylase [Planctomycetota bacterium]
MLDAETKRKIDNCRDVLVGKIPDPKSQVEQITIALIYKFMDDMDQLSVDQGGKPSFFRGEFEKYSWSSIFDPRISGFELFNLYGEALTKMNHNPNIPQLFRDIFKNAYLPYRDPETLRLFLKEIRGFTYDHSEKLGDAFEYLLSVLSSQGDAGQFRTPRHIIDFIVEIVAPQLNETVLDPACGTAGFLISAYKHILKNNPKLSTAQKKRLMNHFVGYDISYDMVRLSLVNMYLHRFPEPHVHEYDTLTSEDRWQDTFDVIMANPPFMSPKGGIRPHSRFSIQAKRSEVLFVDYIAEHLNPSGRAGIIVPEGIIFQSQNAYKALRKMLVENCLWAVVSLPAGVFNPYSGVKTSILLMDKSLAKRIDKILFVKIENDGFNLGAQRRAIDKNDLTAGLKFLNIYKSKIANLSNLKSELSNLKSEISPFAHAVPKSEIAKSGDYNLTGDRYRTFDNLRKSEWPMVELAEVSDLIRGVTFGKKEQLDYETGNSIRIATTKAAQESGIVEKDLYFIPRALVRDDNKLLRNGDILISTANSLNLLGRTTYIANISYEASFGAFMSLIRAKPEKVNSVYLFHCLRTERAKSFFQISAKTTTNISNLSFADLEAFKIPLPPLDVQEKIVAEIDGYQKIIDGARQIVQNYKPTIKIKSDWPRVELEKVAIVQSGGTPSRNVSEYWGGKIPWVGSTVCKDDFVYEAEEFITEKGLENSAAKMFNPKTTLIALVGATIGKTGFLVFGSTTNQNIAGLYPIHEKQLLPEFLFYAVQTLYPNFMLLGAGKFRMANLSFVKSQKIPLPPLDAQKEVVAQIEAEQKIVNENKKLIEIFENKISDTISALWT